MVFDFSIITPSYNMLSYLKMCHASITDQNDVSVEHIVIDGGSTDGTVEWLQEQKNIVWISEKDKGMYDALNKGLRLAQGDIIGHLNADEQYLQGSLKNIINVFTKNPKVDAVYGHTIIVNDMMQCNYLKKVSTLRLTFLSIKDLYVYTASIFHRKSVFKKLNFSLSYTSAGDADFIIRALKSGVVYYKLNKYLSIFLNLGNNKSYSKIAGHESKLVMESHFGQVKCYSKRVRELLFYCERIIQMCYFEFKIKVYWIYYSDNKREKFLIKKKFISDNNFEGH